MFKWISNGSVNCIRYSIHHFETLLRCVNPVYGGMIVADVLAPNGRQAIRNQPRCGLEWDTVSHGAIYIYITTVKQTVFEKGLQPVGLFANGGFVFSWQKRFMWHNNECGCKYIYNTGRCFIHMADTCEVMWGDSGCIYVGAVKWAECSLIIGTGCRVQVFSLILDSSVGLSAGIQSAGDLVSWDPGFKSCIQQRKTTCLLSIWISLACARVSKLTTIYIWSERWSTLPNTALYHVHIKSVTICISWLYEFHFFL